ncbi:uncharacterized protein LOC111357332 [Spodoptera litura]|uniref:Uncharacterized protein LOC111357332 n=1 Tax=Spodoptera litura TaxID=69820 RepID=A0A9J7EG73_SPOLT|nr:uncharacterized protein LOC111357332 [Spodoptera litura]
MFAFLVRYHLAAALELCFNIEEKQKELISMMDNAEQREEDNWEDSWEPSGPFPARGPTLNCSTPSFERAVTVTAFRADEISIINTDDEDYYNIRDLVSISSDETTATDDYVPDDLSFFGEYYMGVPLHDSMENVSSIEEMDFSDFVVVPNDDYPADVSGEIALDYVAPAQVSVSKIRETPDYEVHDEVAPESDAPADASISETCESPDYVVVYEPSVFDRTGSLGVTVVPDEVAPNNSSSVGATTSDDVSSFEKIESSDVSVVSNEKKSPFKEGADNVIQKDESSFKEEEENLIDEDGSSFKEEISSFGVEKSTVEEDDSSFADESSFEDQSSFKYNSSFEEYKSSFERMRFMYCSFPPVAPPAHTLPMPKWVTQKSKSNERPQPVDEDIYRNPQPGPSHAPDFNNAANGSASSAETDQRRIPVVPNEPLRNWIRASMPEVAMPANDIWFPMPPESPREPLDFRNSVWSTDRLHATLAREQLLNHIPQPDEDRVALFFRHFELGTVPPPSKW